MFNIKLGKLIVKEVLGNKSESISCSDEYLAKIGERVIKDSNLFYEVMNNLDINISFDKSNIKIDAESYKTTVSKLSDLVLKLNRDILSDNKESYEYFGKLAYNHFCVDTDEYTGLNSKDKSYLENNPIDIWNCIPDDKKDIVKVYLMNREYFADDETCSEVWDSIQKSIDSIVVNDLKYTYLADGKWCKLSEIGNFIWNIAMRYDSLFANISNKLLMEDDFDLYMELLAKNISDIPSKHEKEQVSRYQIFHYLNNVLNSTDSNSPFDFSESNWSNINWNVSKRSTEIYETMLMATNKLFEQHLSHLVKWDKDELVWKPLENDVDYYIGLTERALEGDLKYQVFESDEGEHDILEIVFENVKDYKGYQPSILMWYDYKGEFSCKSTGVLCDIISMHEEGFSCGLDIAYEGEACSHRTNLIVNNILEIISRKGFNYKMKEVKKDELSVQTSYELENKYKPYYTSIDSETISVYYDSKFKIVSMTDNEEDNNKVFDFSCCIPVVTYGGELKLLKNITVIYNNKSVLIKNNIKQYLGVDKKSLINKIAYMCEAYLRNLEVVLEEF